MSFNIQGCFAIDYDFATHRCYFFGVNVLQAFITVNTVTPVPAVAPVPFFVHCIVNAGVPQPGSQGLRQNPTVVHITLCEFCSLFLRTLIFILSAFKWLQLGLCAHLALDRTIIIRCFLSKNCSLLTQSFITYVRPLLEYCSPVWSPS